MANDHLAENMNLLIEFTSQTEHTELVRRFATMKTHYKVLAALRRQLTRPGGSEGAWRVLEHSGTLIM